VRMAVYSGWRAVCSPTSVCNTSVGLKGLLEVDIGRVNQASKLDNLTDLLEGDNLALLVSVDGKTCRVIATIFEPGKACIEQVTSVVSRIFGMWRTRELGMFRVAWRGGEGSKSHH